MIGEERTRHGKAWVRSGLVIGLACIVCLGTLPGCTRESVRVALETQRRADTVQQTVFDRQHEALCILLYRDLLRRLEGTGLQPNDAQRAAINEVWNERDLIEFWALQHERAKALRLLGVDAKLYSDQSAVDLLLKSVGARVARGEQALAADTGHKVTK
jgi:hypothetical protein